MPEVPARWWQAGERSIEDEQAWFAASQLDFELDEAVLRERDLVVFTGQLRLGERRAAATVVYPPAYAHGGHPEVEVPDLAVGRHKAPTGRLCLDHPVFGNTEPMCGAEAVERAERLWWLWAHDRAQLDDEEADAPDPAANYYEYLRGSGVTLLDVDVAGGTQGFFRLQAHSLAPLRGPVVGVRTMLPTPRVDDKGQRLAALAGPTELAGAWRRVDAPPPFAAKAVGEWLVRDHRPFLEQQLQYAREAGKAAKRSDLPAVLGFVYPDEGPQRGETHDAWLFVVVRPVDAGIHLAQAFHLRAEERWIRQPQMHELAGKSVVIVGTGALGGEVADLLAKAGVGDFCLTDYDIVSHGNRVRHILDLRDAGRPKVDALSQRLRSVNPWCDVTPVPWRLGAGNYDPDEGSGQAVDDGLFERMRSANLIVDAAANSVAGSYVSALSAQAGTAALHTWVSAGAWSARVLHQRPGLSGCWDCMALWQSERAPGAADVQVPEAASDPAASEVNEQGCADPTFTGPGFELSAAAAAAARVAVQALLEGTEDYPPADFDLATIVFRDGAAARQSATYSRLPVHPECTTCRASR